MKRTVRINEADLHKIVRQSVRNVLNEEHGGTHIQNVLEAIENAIYANVDSEIAELAQGDRLNMMIHTLQRFVRKTFVDACSLERSRMNLSSAFNENHVRGIVKGVLREWADEKDFIKAYHVTSIGDTEDQEGADYAYHIYDMLTHNEMTAEEAIYKITNGDMSADTEVEFVPRSAHIWGHTKDGRYFLTYDQYVGAFDVWEKA